MADHARRQIRDAVKTALLDLPTTGVRVYAGRTRRLAAAHDPSLLIYTHNETSKAGSFDERGRILERALTVSIEGRVSAAGVDAPDDLLDQIAAEVEGAMESVLNIQAPMLVRPVQFLQTEFSVDGENERQLGGVRLTYLLTYRTIEGRPLAMV